MVLIFYRIQSNIPVIIMGETGCGKTSLIRKLNEVINNEILEKFDIHSGITDQDIISKMKDINEKAENNKEIWLFFDEINTCKSMGLLSEIFCKHSFDGEELKKNIKLIGACNPYRESSRFRPQNALQYEDLKNNQKELVYLVNPLPFNLMHFVYYFKNIEKNTEKEYIKSILSNNILINWFTNVIMTHIKFQTY